jgi:hypothetical protein
VVAHVQVGDVREGIEDGDAERSHEERFRERLHRVAGLLGDEGHRVPGVISEERFRHSHRERGEDAAGYDGRKPGREIRPVTLARENPGDDERRERPHLGDGEDVLDPGAFFHAAGVDPREDDHQQDRDHLRTREIESARFHEAVGLAHPGKEDSEVVRESDGDRGDETGLDYQEDGPAVEEGEKRRERFLEKDVLAAGARKRGGELPVGERTA